MSKKRRGRPAPDYGLRICPLCARKLYFNLKTQRYYCAVCEPCLTTSPNPTPKRD